ncbi:MAG: secondary thiamine-phosphate synthase enzyme YjbQ [Spirochaetaceae bacterium]
MKHSIFRTATKGKTELLDITSQVKGIVRKSGIGDGMCTVFIPHTTCGVTLNENADPSVRSDIRMELDKIVPLQDGYAHMEGNSAAHIKASLMGSSVSIPLQNGDLMLGTWQGIYLCEFDGPRTRSVVVTLGE